MIAEKGPNKPFCSRLENDPDSPPASPPEPFLSSYGRDETYDVANLMSFSETYGGHYLTPLKDLTGPLFTNQTPFASALVASEIVGQDAVGHATTQSLGVQTVATVTRDMVDTGLTFVERRVGALHMRSDGTSDTVPFKRCASRWDHGGVSQGVQRDPKADEAVRRWHKTGEFTPVKGESSGHSEGYGSSDGESDAWDDRETLFWDEGCEEVEEDGLDFAWG